MQPYYEHGGFTIYHGDCREVLGEMEHGTVDAVVTDPPYGMGFMGQDWDREVPGAEFWAAVLGVVKPGAHLVAFGGTRTYHRLWCAIEDAGWKIRDGLMWLYGTGFPKSHNLGGEWDGWGTALKPAWEPICLARAPLDGTVAANVTEHGTGAINVDGCRVGTSKRTPYADNRNPPNNHFRPTSDSVPGARFMSRMKAKGGTKGGDPNEGRWPANVVVDETAAALVDAQSGVTTSTGGTFRNLTDKRHGFMANIGASTGGLGDTGGASRFYYCAKASRAERGSGNDHPTVKPVALMRWLVRLVTPKGGVVLDPFCGSGSTGVAAVSEGYGFVGVEINQEYTELARGRIAEAGRQGMLQL